MAELRSGPYRLEVKVAEILGDIGDRSLAGARYLVKLGFEGADDLAYCGFSKYHSDLIRHNGTLVTDEAPDDFFRVFKSAMESDSVISHQTMDGRLSVGLYPAEACRGVDWVGQPCEPVNFKGDPENVFKVVVSVHPYQYKEAGMPVGGGVALVLPVYRSVVEVFLSEWLAEFEEAPRHHSFMEHPHKEALLRWMPGA